jgi:hypothetical protein
VNHIFEVRLESPPDREKLVASLITDHEQMAEINQETDTLLVLELYPRRDGQPWVVDFEKFLVALQNAKRRLVGTD